MDGGGGRRKDKHPRSSTMRCIAVWRRNGETIWSSQMLYVCYEGLLSHKHCWWSLGETCCAITGAGQVLMVTFQSWARSAASQACGQVAWRRTSAENQRLPQGRERTQCVNDPLCQLASLLPVGSEYRNETWFCSCRPKLLLPTNRSAKSCSTRRSSSRRSTLR